MGSHATSTQGHANIESAVDGKARIARLFELTSDLLATISLDGRFTLLNPAWEHLLGWTRDELRERPIRQFVHPDDVEQALGPLLDRDASAASELENITTRYQHRDGSWRWLLWSARRDGDSWYAAAKDVTDRVWLERQALHDPLTGLPNRLLLMDRARQALARLHRSNGVVAMLFIDLDKFKAVNDNLGHEVGDRLLLSVSERLGELMRDSDTVARMGGDEFVILAEDIDGDGEAVALAERVLDALEHPFPLGSAEVAILASVGISVARRPDVDPDAMLREADVAMYRAKGAGGRRLELFDESLRRELDAHMELEGRLRDALPQHELLLAYQPILRLAGGQALGVEALVRWRPTGAGHTANTTVLASMFLPPAEDSELIVQIGSWVLHEACAQAAIWRRAGITIPLSVNISARELTELDLAERVREELAHFRLPGRALCLEISEEAVLRDPERARSALKDLKRLGVLIALDKFGFGQLSLGLPSNLPLDVVKLDRALTGSFHQDKERRAMFAATIALAKEAGLTAVAVGIETNRQLALARELDCAVGQGFLLHGPASPDRVRLRAPAGSVTSAPWRPLVRLRGSSN
ncbi:MAG TPA: EAL domain-containing protein [Solirubrobacteraceae bacterium]|jgi:diguanylate cyclase (GGDEF)-like protein/PAS domain S-box-containing protein|nr:EAL domain-containing protein [Solirubrobacteraceae bacterium]